MSLPLPSPAASTATAWSVGPRPAWLWVPTVLAAVAAGLPGATHDAAAAAPWALLTEPLGGTWLALMTLLAATALLLMAPSRWRAGVATLLGGTAAWVTADALGVAIGSGRIDASPVLAQALSGPVGGRILLLVGLMAGLAPLIWSLRDGSSRARWVASGSGVLVLVLTGSLAHVGFDATVMESAPIVALGQALAEGSFTGDRIAALWVFMALLVAVVPAVAHVYDHLTAARVAVWATLTCLLLLPLSSVALLSASAAQWPLALEAFKYALTLTAALTLCASSIAALAARSPG